MSKILDLLSLMFRLIDNPKACAVKSKLTKPIRSYLVTCRMNRQTYKTK
jgi:hypothetical protein